jgi:hypothetical protein
MMGRKMPETCWAVNKRQDNILENCCIWWWFIWNGTLKSSYYFFSGTQQMSLIYQEMPLDDNLQEDFTAKFRRVLI